LRIEDTEGIKLFQHTQVDAPRLFTERDMRALDSMLVQVVARGTGQAAQLSQGHVAGKTGTSQDYRDAWFIGYTDRLVTGVWLGKDNSDGMERISGGGYPARIWHDYMQGSLGISVPMFSPRIQREATRGSDGFSNMLNRLFGGGNDDALLPPGQNGSMLDGFKGDNTRPTYNR
jgi:penicillin-binding protein 1A